MKHCKYFGLFLLSFFYVANVAAQSITQSCTDIVLDGKGDDSAWENIAWTYATFALPGSSIQNTTLGGTTSAGRWKATFDNDFVYLLIEVYDDQQPYNSFWNDPNTGPDGTSRGWEGDGVELYLDAGNGCNGNPLQLGLTYPTPDITTPGTYGNQACSNMTFTDFEAFINRWTPGEHSWTMEVKFPAAANGVNLTGNAIHFEVGITQANQTSGTSSRATLVHSFSAGDKYNQMNALRSLTVNRDNWANASSTSVCDGESVNLLPNNPAYIWQQSSDNISWSYIPSSTVTPAGNTYYRFVNAGNLSCPVQIEIKTIASKPTVTTPVDYCEGAAVNALPATGDNLLWYTAATGGTGSATAPVPNTAATGSTPYFVSQTPNNSCESERAEINVTVHAAPVGGTTSADQEICYDTAPADITLSGQTGNIQWQWSDSNNDSDWTDIAGATGTTLSAAQMGKLTATRFYRAVLNNGAFCADAYSSVLKVTVLDITAPECLLCPDEVRLKVDGYTACIQEGDNQTITLTASVPNLNPSDYVLSWWYENDIEIPGTAGKQSIEISTADKPVDSYRYMVRADKPDCPPVFSTTTITVSDPMRIQLVAQNEAGAALPDNTTAIKRAVHLEALLISGALPAIYIWSWDGSSIIDDNEVWVSPLQTTTYSVTAKVDERCTASDQITINVIPLPTAFIPSRGDDHINSVFPVSADALDQQIILYKNLTVYNRYGQEVYNGNRRWDGTVKGGKLAAPGTYFYIITFDDDETLKGTIEVIK